jgi:hypothetical protein
VFNGQDSQGLGDYYADADIWNPYPGMSQSMGVCSYNSWYTADTADNSSGDGAVKAYPNVHYDFIDWGTGVLPKLSSYNSITTRFANTSPRVGIYDTAYDIWFNDIGNSSTSNEVMIWTDNKDQYPLGSLRGETTFSGVTWDVWATNPDSTGASYVAFIPVNGGVVTSGTVDVKAVAAYLQGTTVNGVPLLPANSTIGQVDYGVEVVSTNGSPARWDFTDFAVTTS